MKENNKALALRTCAKDGSAYGGFKWSLEIGSIVTAPDWNDAKQCGGGLHALLDGNGDYSLLSNNADAVWQVVEVDRDKCVVIDNSKVKFESCKIVYSGNMASALTMIGDYWIKLILKEKLSNDNSQAASGHSSKLAASGHFSKLAASGHSSKLAASGDQSIAVSIGINSIVSAGENGCIALSFLNERKKRFELVVGYVGEKGIKENVSYKLNDKNKFEEVK